MGKPNSSTGKKVRKGGGQIKIKTPEQINTSVPKCSTEILKSSELRKVFAKAFSSSLSILTDPCQVCHTDVETGTGKYKPDPEKAFLFACIGVLDRDGSVREDEYFVVPTSELSSVTDKPLIFAMTPNKKRVSSCVHHGSQDL